MFYRENDLGPVKKKSVKKIIAQKLKHDYGLLGDKVIDLLSLDILAWYSELNMDAHTLYPGQTVWLAVDVTEKHHPHKKMEDTKLIPVKLTIHSNEDIDLYLLPQKKWRDVVKQRIIRLLTEAYSQGGVLTQTDVAALLSISRKTVQRYIAEYEKENSVNLPYRGRIHDIGPTMSHKAAIVELMVKGYATTEVAKKMNHSIKSCDNYYKDYKRVVKLGKSFALAEISTLTGMSESLIKEYIALADKLDYRL
jgi:predicted transcriptional regulator